MSKIFAFTTEPGWFHYLESKDVLTPGPWTFLASTIRTGTGGELTVQLTGQNAAQRFYRAALTP